jgi:hypothetical protein
MDDATMTYYKKRLAALDESDRENRIERKVILDHMASMSDRKNGAEATINPPVGACRRHTDYCFRTVVANPGRLKRDQIITYVKPKIRCNSKDPDQSVGDALSKLVREKKLRIDDDGFYWPNENPIRRTKEAHQSMFSADHSPSR